MLLAMSMGSSGGIAPAATQKSLTFAAALTAAEGTWTGFNGDGKDAEALPMARGSLLSCAIAQRKHPRRKAALSRLVVKAMAGRVKTTGPGCRLSAAPSRRAVQAYRSPRARWAPTHRRCIAGCLPAC